MKRLMEDKDLRDKIRLKCRNDWDLELTEDQISMCIIEMEEQRLSLFAGQIWPNRRKLKKKIRNPETGYMEDVWTERVTWDRSIDGYRAIAQRSGRLIGIQAPQFSKDSDNNDLIAHVTLEVRSIVNGKPIFGEFVGEARFSEYVQLVDEWVDGRKTGKKVPNHQWKNSPRNQLAVAAERQALRKAFQEAFAGGDVVLDPTVPTELDPEIQPPPEPEETTVDEEPPADFDTPAPDEVEGASEPPPDEASAPEPEVGERIEKAKAAIHPLMIKYLEQSNTDPRTPTAAIFTAIGFETEANELEDLDLNGWRGFYQKLKAAVG